MLNLVPLYLYTRHREGASVESLAKELGVAADLVALRLEAARLCFDVQCRIALQP